MNINSNPKLAISALLLSTILLGCGDNKTPTEYMAEAKAALNDGQKSVAIINLKNVLKNHLLWSIILPLLLSCLSCLSKSWWH